MGRELKRVPLSFDWPIGKTWEGYLNPHYVKCPDCENGSTEAYRWLEAVVRLLMLVGADGKRKGTGRGIWPHPWLRDFNLAPNCDPPVDMAQLTEGLAGREMSFMGHDACDQYSACQAIVKAAGLPKSWGTCKTCKGSSVHPDHAKAYNKWRKHEPPKGKGFQLWETTSEGSPVSPVFATLDALCEWCAVNATTFGDSKATAEQWHKMLDANFVCHQEGNAIFI